MHFNRNRCTFLCFVNRVKYMMIHLTTCHSCYMQLWFPPGSVLQVVFKIWRQLFYNFLSSCKGLLVLRAQLGRKPEKQNFMNVREESNLKKEKRELANPLCVHGKLRSGLGFPRSCQVPNQRAHRDPSDRRFADVQNIYKGSHEHETLRHNSPCTQHIHWKTEVQFTVQ